MFSKHGAVSLYRQQALTWINSGQGFCSLSGLTARSREISKPRDSGWDFSNRSKLWQVPRHQRCRDDCQIAQRYDHNLGVHGSIYNLGHKLRCQYAFSINANIAIFFVAYESVCVLRSKSEYGVLIKYSLPFHNRAQTWHVFFFVPSVTDISWHHGWAIQGSSDLWFEQQN